MNTPKNITYMKTYEIPLTMTGVAPETFTALLTFYQGPILNYFRLDSFDHEYSAAMLGHLEADIPADIYEHVVDPIGVKNGDLTTTYKTSGLVVVRAARMIFDMDEAKLYIYSVDPDDPTANESFAIDKKIVGTACKFCFPL